MAQQDAIKKALLASAMFRSLPGAELDEIAAMARCKEFKKDAIVFRAGERVSGFYVVVRGRVKVYRFSPAGKELILHVIEPGMSFAEAATVMGDAYPAFASTLAPSVLLHIPKERFLNTVERNPRLALGMMASMAAWLQRMRELLEDLTLKDVDARLAEYLLGCARNGCGASQQPISFDLDVDRGTLASRIGTIRETLSRSFRRFQDRRVMAVRGRKITILDMQSLKAIASSSQRR